MAARLAESRERTGAGIMAERLVLTEDDDEMLDRSGRMGLAGLTRPDKT